MTLIFVNSAAEIFFWIFFSSALAAVGIRIVFSLRGLQIGKKLSPLPLFFWGLAVVCLAPKSPLVYSALFVYSAADLCRLCREKSGAAELFARGMFFFALILQLIVISELLADSLKIPRVMFLILIPAFAAAGGGALGSGFTRKKRGFQAVFMSVLDALEIFATIFNLAFAVALAVANFLYATLFLLFGAVYSATAEIFIRFGAKYLNSKSGEIYFTILFMVAQILLSAGMILSMTAVLID